MYPFIRDLFVHFLAFKAEDVFTDTATEHGGIPDVAVMAPTGVLDAKGKPPLYVPHPHQSQP